MPPPKTKSTRQAITHYAMDEPGSALPGQVVLVMQGGGALGAFQAGVYEALHEAGIEPAWVVGTSIGAINGAIIAGNAPENRLDRLKSFWEMVASGKSSASHWNSFGMGNMMHNLGAITQGIPGFFTPNQRSWFGAKNALGVTEASYYSTDPLRHTLNELADFERIAQPGMRLTLGAVNVRSGNMHYFDSRDEELNLDHVMASGALPPAFPAVMIKGEPYWDGGIYSNTPIEVVMDDNPRRNSVIFAAQLWQKEDQEPNSIEQVMARLKDIQFSSRAESHTARQEQIHHLRHIIRELGFLLPDNIRSKSTAKELLGWGCGTVMHVIPLLTPSLAGEDNSKDLDFTPAGIEARWAAGLELTRQRIKAAEWKQVVDPVAGIIVHNQSSEINRRINS